MVGLGIDGTGMAQRKLQREAKGYRVGEARVHQFQCVLLRTACALSLLARVIVAKSAEQPGVAVQSQNGSLLRSYGPAEQQADPGGAPRFGASNAMYKDFIQDCPSGYMTKEEFQQIYGQFFPSGDPTRFVDYVFNVFDVDKNGVITFKEFILAISITTKGTVEEKLDWAFSLYDFDRDGFVSRGEMLDIVAAIHRMHGRGGPEPIAAQRRVEALFTKLDTDGDGKLNREEFCRGFKSDPWIMRALMVRSPGIPQDGSRRPSGPCDPFQ